MKEVKINHKLKFQTSCFNHYEKGMHVLFCLFISYFVFIYFLFYFGLFLLLLFIYFNVYIFSFYFYCIYKDAGHQAMTDITVDPNLTRLLADTGVQGHQTYTGDHMIIYEDN